VEHRVDAGRIEREPFTPHTRDGPPPQADRHAPCQWRSPRPLWSSPDRITEREAAVR
jgi:hypothetical protein